MKMTRLRIVALALLAFVATFIGSTTQAPAAVNIGISVGVPPPPMQPDYRWGRPYPGAVWIPGHHEWINGRWIWVGGYYGYPPRRGGYWVKPRWHHGYYYPGHWA
jgi:hypothetical protein